MGGDNEDDEAKKPKAIAKAKSVPSSVSGSANDAVKPDKAEEEGSDEGGPTTVSHNERWEHSFKRLKAFQKKHGHCEVPFRYAPDTRLGRWVAFQRTMYRRMSEGKPETVSLTPERIRRLERIGFEWRVKGKTDPQWVQWDTRYRELIEFVKEFNHCLVPVGWERNPKLATWVAVQRKQASRFREGREDSQITQEQIGKLTEIGFVWEDATKNDPVASRSNGFARAPLLSACDGTSTGPESSAAIALNPTSSTAPSPSGIDSLLASLGRPLHPSFPHLPHTHPNFQTVAGMNMLQSLGTHNPINPFQHAAFASAAAGNHALNMMALRGAPAFHHQALHASATTHPNSAGSTANDNALLAHQQQMNMLIHSQRQQLLELSNFFQGNNNVAATTSSTVPPSLSTASALNRPPPLFVPNTANSSFQQQAPNYPLGGVSSVAAHLAAARRPHHRNGNEGTTTGNNNGAPSESSGTGSQPGGSEGC